jgi:hypothetical protein
MNSSIQKEFFLGDILSNCARQKAATDVDVCRYLTEPGDPEYMITNEDGCRAAISKEIGAVTREVVHMLNDAVARTRFDVRAERYQQGLRRTGGGAYGRHL